MIQRHGTERILFGTDWPWYCPQDVVRWIDSMDISTAQKEQIYYGNAMRILGL
jgi:predicted TIM-barrel fold metal-dependent hydrolase